MVFTNIVTVGQLKFVMLVLGLFVLHEFAVKLTLAETKHLQIHILML